MALPTYAQSAAEWSRLNIHPVFGMLYHDSSPIFRAFGAPQTVPAGRLKVNYTDGATAASLGTGAGAPSTGAPAFVDDTQTKVFAGIASQSSIDLATLTQGGGFEAEQSANAAVASIYREFVNQLISLQDGETAYKLWGAGDFIGTVTQASGGQRVSGSYAAGAMTSALLKQSIGKSLSLLPQDGSMNICILPAVAYEAVYTAIEGQGGTTPLMTAQETFGFSNLVYRNCVFFASDLAKTNNGVGAGTKTTADMWFFNTGPQGVGLFAPDSVPLIQVDGPKLTAGYISRAWDVVLNCQVLYKSHLAAVKSTQWVTN
jgi:hypothetical protein